MTLPCSLLRLVVALLLLLLLLGPRAGHAQSTLERERALVAIVGLDLTSADMVAWCEASAPTEATPVRAAWQRWRVRAAIAEVSAQLTVDLLDQARRSKAQVAASTLERLRSAGAPAAVCRQLPAVWDNASFDTRSLFRIAYAGAAATGEASQGGRDFDSGNYHPISRPRGEFYTVQQLTTLFEGWHGKPRDFRRARARLEASGPLFVRGRVVQRGERHFLEGNDGTFTSKLSVAPKSDLAALAGQEVTLLITLKELPASSLLFVQDSRVVRDPSGLTPSALAEDPGRVRLEVDVTRITAGAGRGAPARLIRGMHYRGYGTTGFSGFEFREELRLLFADGWAYTREDLPPPDLDVEASRRLEPQRWERWRTAGAEYEFQAQDDFGRPDGDWEVKPGRVLTSFRAGQRLSGGYTATAFYGSIGLGGTFSKSTYVFGEDGRYEFIGFSRSASGSMAAQGPGGFSAAGTGSTSGSGTSSAAGGGHASVFAGSRTEVRDGAKNRGTYRLDGMTLELRSDAGEVRRLLCVPLDGGVDAIYMLGQFYSRKP